MAKKVNKNKGLPLIDSGCLKDKEHARCLAQRMKVFFVCIRVAFLLKMCGKKGEQEQGLATNRQWLFKRQRTCAVFSAAYEGVFPIKWCVKRFFPIFIVFTEKKIIFSKSFLSILCLTVVIKWFHSNSYTSLVFLFRPVDQLKP